MTKSLQFAVRGLLLGGLAMVASQANAQLKVGTNPTKVDKSAILELESDRQGLLLPRIADTSLMTTLNPPNGMIIYLTKAGEQGLYVRDLGKWVPMGRGGQSWDILGNALDASKSPFIGSTNNVPFVLKGNNIEGINIDNGKVTVSNGITIKNIAEDQTATKGMMLDPTTGIVSWRQFGTSAFTDAFGINGDKTPDFNLEVPTGVAYKFVAPSAGHLQLNIPNQDGTGTVSAGLLTLADWQKFNSTSQYLVVANFSNLPSAGGITIDSTSVPGSKRLSLTAADDTHPGGISIGNQVFAGEKSFLDKITAQSGLDVTNGDGNFSNNITVTKNATVNGDLIASGNATIVKDVTLPGVLTSTNAADNSVLILDATNKVVKKTLPASAFTPPTYDTAHYGTTNVAIAYDGNANKVTVNIPYADKANAGGLVTNGQQTIGGQKDFDAAISVRDKALIGVTTPTPTPATSTLQVQGSVAMAFKEVISSYTLTDQDYTVVVKSAAQTNITLPAANTCPGRTYVIKKGASALFGNIDNDITVKLAGAGDNIEGGSTYTIYNDWTFITVQSNGKDTWYIIKK
ncbi:MAG: hypothetical protein JO154_23140 [Chitinophaga sp.]|uniref:hypothetical protein n=1 Tax=Chitinophaga sp. TaxID=1869181 RepID=UPI0025C192F0|nr:hypothetical protein [Chitinophaga sp.]MBV8255512.1 hypothetical protein [Chitinophaga sp.]